MLHTLLTAYYFAPDWPTFLMTHLNITILINNYPEIQIRGHIIIFSDSVRTAPSLWATGGLCKNC